MSNKEEKTKNCPSCNKSLKRVNWYYRNGKHFCNLSCFKKAIAKEREKAA